MMNKLDQALQFHQTVLSLRSQRQQVLAANIANADTPGYKARDFDFQGAMQAALAGKPQTSPAVLTRTAANHIAGSSAGQTSGGVPLQYRGVVQASLDSNTVDMDVERNQFADNALRYEASVTMVSGQIKSLLTAIAG